MLAQFCSACSLLPCPVNLNRSVGGQLMEAAEVSVAKAFRQLVGGGRGSTAMLKISLLSPSVPCLCLFALYSCVCLCASCRFQRAASNPYPPKPLSRRKKTLPRCSAPKGRHNVTFDQFLFGHKKPHTDTHRGKSPNFKMVSADSGWHFWSTMIHTWLWREER